MRGWVCRRVTACRCRRVATGLRRMFASHEWVGACRDAIRREHTAWDCANLACAAAATVGCLRRLSRGLDLDARRQHEKAFAQSERARVGGLCEVSPPAVLVRRQPFIGPVGQGCRMGCQLHVNFQVLQSSVIRSVRPARSEA